MTMETFYAKDRAAWRRWLHRNHQKADGIWFIFYKKASGKPTVEYNDAVEEALCFGWIDGKVKTIDGERYRQLFTPRKPKSMWAQSNKDRVKRLIAAGLMTDAGMGAITVAKSNGAWSAYDAVEKLVIPPDLKKALAAVPKAAKNFDAFAPSARRGILQWIQSAKRPETRAKRIAETARMAGKNLRINFDPE